MLYNNSMAKEIPLIRLVEVVGKNLTQSRKRLPEVPVRRGYGFYVVGEFPSKMPPLPPFAYDSNTSGVPVNVLNVDTSKNNETGKKGKTKVK
jgi:NADH:ubiquinone oxidoreductase subunit F (NADH-binding)